MSVSKAKVNATGSDGKFRKPEPAEIVHKNMRFLITYRPTDATMDKFIEVWVMSWSLLTFFLCNTIA